MIIPEVYREAAKHISKGKSQFCCLALDLSFDKYYKEEIELFTYYFKPEDITPNEADHNGWFGNIYSQENQECRVLALLLMAEIANDLAPNNKGL